MIHTILVPLDGSHLAEAALPEARRLARATDATIVLVRLTPVGTALQDRWATQLSALAEAEEYLRVQARELSSAGFGVHTDVFCSDPAEGIGLAAMSHGASLIVMGTHGRSGFGRALLGSVATQVVHEASRPVVLVRGHRPARPAGPYRKILVPLDGTTLAESALRYIAREDFAREATVVLLESVPAANAPSAPELITTAYVPTRVYEQECGDAEHRRAQATHYLYSAALTHLGERPWDSVVAVGAPAEQILDLARDEGFDLIAMATHGRMGADRLIHGSVAGEVVRHATVPVLLVRGEAKAAQAPEQAMDRVGALEAPPT